ncbi:MAG: Holliday junction branch migration protein RuvA [Muribaculaceae bacterium]|nr:Holliday junction branch migration protein RuvA [Muribaculaceae bacterium]
MIEYIRGAVASLNPAATVLETSGGVGYLLSISLQTFSALEGKKEVRLHVHEVIREDTYQLYGFATERERELFRMLIGVSGVGASTALIVLSSLGSRDLENVIATGDSKRLKGVKGIGTKTAERIIVDLRDKIKSTDATLVLQPGETQASRTAAFEEAHAALVMLGFDRKASEKVLTAIFKESPAVKVEEAIKKALPRL